MFEGGDWKERHCVLRGGRLLMYKDKDRDTPTQTIDLERATTLLEPYEVSKK